MAWITVIHSLAAAALLPLAGFALLRLSGSRLGGRANGGGGATALLSIGISALSFVCAVAALVLWVAKDEVNQSHHAEALTFVWMPLPAADAQAGGAWSAQSARAMGAGVAGTPSDQVALTGGWLVDSLTVGLFVAMTFVALMAQVFSSGSAVQARDRARYFAMLQLLMFSVLAMLLANSLVQLLVLWQWIGVAGWLLMAQVDGHEGQMPESNSSGFSMLAANVAGGGALLAGIGLLVMQTGSISGWGLFDAQGNSILAATMRNALGVRSTEYLRFTQAAGGAGVHWLTWVGIGFGVAAMARMGQFPFQAWVNRAARTNAVVAGIFIGVISLGSGVYLLARIYPILTLDARFILAIVGVLTLLMGGLCALMRHDARELLAWAAVSQGGYMLLFLGVGGYVAGVVHLFTQMFIFTALFLAAGVVAEGLGSRDLRQMGGLWKRFPLTAAASLVATLALAGVPWLSGAYSRNLGMACVRDYSAALVARHGGWWQWVFYGAAVGGAYLAALGIGRWWWLTFAGANRNAKLLEKARESPVLTLPVFILAGLSLGVWYSFSGAEELIRKSLVPSIGSNGFAIEGTVGELALLRWAFLGLGAAAVFYGSGFGPAERLRHWPVLKVMDYWLRQRMFFEPAFGALARSLLWVARQTVGLVDSLADGVVRGLELIVRSLVKAVGRLEGVDRCTAPPPEAPSPEEPL